LVNEYTIQNTSHNTFRTHGLVGLVGAEPAAFVPALDVGAAALPDADSAFAAELGVAAGVSGIGVDGAAGAGVAVRV
jgi:hypothetical protein